MLCLCASKHPPGSKCALNKCLQACRRRKVALPSYLPNSSTSYLVVVDAANTAGDVMAPAGCTLENDDSDTMGACAAGSPSAFSCCGVPTGKEQRFPGMCSASNLGAACQASSLPKSHPTGTHSTITPTPGTGAVSFTCGPLLRETTSSLVFTASSTRSSEHSPQNRGVPQSCNS